MFTHHDAQSVFGCLLVRFGALWCTCPTWRPTESGQSSALPEPDRFNFEPAGNDPIVMLKSGN